MYIKNAGPHLSIVHCLHQTMILNKNIIRIGNNTHLRIWCTYTCNTSTLLYSLQVEINTNAVIGPQVNMPIQNTDTEAPIVQPNPKTSAIRCRPTPPPKPKKTFSMKTSELQDALTDTDCLHDGGRMTIQVFQK